ncbi:hypothetical protein GCM10010503_60890 [Streptomyces lucensis JCM 4490]|uniref:Uncharacterized protein n=1 Tax=Streptomyces lucensis JCM 4490 TaxID=1306176 RepID=A0A918JCV5_9ACTN|nr:hypothetical protein [Streptomyces lucensis]GGW75135.1 hypothetical protein GCM10010503_60890 [Streptomyces lucensis JCM 4490]
MLALRLTRAAHPAVQLRRLLVAAASAGTGFLLLSCLGHALHHPEAVDASALRLAWCTVPFAATVYFALAVARTDPGTRPRPGLSAVGLGPARLMAVSALTTALSCGVGSLLALLLFLHLRGDLTGMPLNGAAADFLAADRPLPVPGTLTLLVLLPAVASTTVALALRPKDPRPTTPGPRGYGRFGAYGTAAARETFGAYGRFGARRGTADGDRRAPAGRTEAAAGGNEDAARLSPAGRAEDGDRPIPTAQPRHGTRRTLTAQAGGGDHHTPAGRTRDGNRHSPAGRAEDSGPLAGAAQARNGNPLTGGGPGEDGAPLYPAGQARDSDSLIASGQAGDGGQEWARSVGGGGAGTAVDGVPGPELAAPDDDRPGAVPPPGDRTPVGLPWGIALLAVGLAAQAYAGRSVPRPTPATLPGEALTLLIGWLLTAVGLVLAAPGLTHLCGRLLQSAGPGALRLLAGRVLMTEAGRIGRPLGVLCAVASAGYAMTALYGAPARAFGPLTTLGALLVAGCSVATLLTAAVEARQCRAATVAALLRLGAPAAMLRAAAALRAATLVALFGPLTLAVAALAALPTAR